MQTKTSRFKKHPRTFRAITGLSAEKFTQLYTDLTPLYDKAETKRLKKSKRKRKQGGGRTTNNAINVLPPICNTIQLA